jgi:hypothetical protein
MKIKKVDPFSKQLPNIPVSQDESTAWTADYNRGPARTENDKSTTGRFLDVPCYRACRICFIFIFDRFYFSFDPLGQTLIFIRTNY